MRPLIFTLMALLPALAWPGEITVFGQTLASSRPLRVLVYDTTPPAEPAADERSGAERSADGCDLEVLSPGRIVIPLGGQGWRGRGWGHGAWGWGAGWVNVNFDLNEYYRQRMGQTRRLPRSTITVSGDY